jgi:hypothetical protein
MPQPHVTFRNLKSFHHAEDGLAFVQLSNLRKNRHGLTTIGDHYYNSYLDPVSSTSDLSPCHGDDRGCVSTIKSIFYKWRGFHSILENKAR